MSNEAGPGADEAGEGSATSRRRYPSTLGGACYLAMLLVTVTGLVLTMTVDWRLGVRVIAGSLWGLALFRTVMPDHEAGMLAVRSRPADVALLVVVGAALVFLAGSIPDQPTLPAP